MRTICGILCVLLLASTLSAQDSSRGDYRDKYGVLSERNMFMKDRVRGRGEGSSTQPTSRPADAPLTPEESYILRGVIYENDMFTAYFENLNTSRMEAVNVGAELAQIHVADIALDAVELEKNGQTQWITIGKDLRGAAARQVRSGNTGSAPSVAATPGAATSADPTTLSKEEQMRQRRAQERGK